MFASSVCSIAPCSVTVMVSLEAPTSSFTLATAVCPNSTCTVAVACLNPACDTVTSYCPGFSSVNSYVPVDPVTADSTSPVVPFFKLTAAPAITDPDGSVMIPVSPPVTVLCACTSAGNESMKINAMAQTANLKFL